MIRRPPRSTLFPYTRSSDLLFMAALLPTLNSTRLVEVDELIYARRSEEHTSELQSQFHLVCRLLLEKKKKNHKAINLNSSTISLNIPTFSSSTYLSYSYTTI